MHNPGNALWNYGARSSYDLLGQWKLDTRESRKVSAKSYSIACAPASECEPADLYITDPPYADAVSYHEITEVFISWMQADLPSPFNKWIWDSRRSLAIKGVGLEFRQKMAEAYTRMADQMPENGYQCVMFTHSSVKVWVDITNILWASGLQVVSAWCVATETATSFREGNYIQGTVLLVLKKRLLRSKRGSKQEIMPKVKVEVERQVHSMMNMSAKTMNEIGEPLFGESDIQMAGQAAALRVLTSYTALDGEDVTAFTFRANRGEGQSVVEEIVIHAIDVSNNLLVPDQFDSGTWSRLSGIEKFYIRMLYLNTRKLDTYQNFAKAFRIVDYEKLLVNVSANSAKLKQISSFRTNELLDNSELGKTKLCQLILALQQLFIENLEPRSVLSDLQNSVSDFLLVRNDLINILEFIELKSPEEAVREAATVLKGQLRNVRVFNQ